MTDVPKSLRRFMRQIHRAGEKLFIDFAGPTVELTGGARASISVAAMGTSGYCFATATPAQTEADWLGATAQALVVHVNRYEPKMTEYWRAYANSALPACKRSTRPFQSL